MAVDMACNGMYNIYNEDDDYDDDDDDDDDD